MSKKADAQRSFLAGVYRNIARRYRLSNSILTFGLDARWRRVAVGLALGHFARMREGATGEMPEGAGTGASRDGLDRGDARRACGPEARRPAILDVCTGTGEMARLLLERVGEGASVAGLDLSREMLLEAVRDNGPEGGHSGDPPGIGYVMAGMDAIPFPEGTFDLVTMGFAMRNNSPDDGTLERRLDGIRRVLRPGGIFVNVETGQPGNPAIRWLRDLFAKLYVRPVGGAVSGDRAGFSYLASSIRSFYGEAELERIFASAGLEKLGVKRLMMGMVAVHVYSRPQRTGIAADTEGGH